MGKTGRLAFTIVELMIVLVIIGIAAAIAVPMISSAGSVQVRAAANMLAADLEYAKSMAISHGQYYWVVFDTSTEKYWVEDASSAIVAHPVNKGSNYEVDFKNDSRLDRVDIASVTLNPTGVAIGFDYLGSPLSRDAGGNVQDLNSGTITLQGGGVTKTVSVEAVTGFISAN